MSTQEQAKQAKKEHLKIKKARLRAQSYDLPRNVKSREKALKEQTKYAAWREKDLTKMSERSAKREIREEKYFSPKEINRRKRVENKNHLMWVRNKEYLEMRKQQQEFQAFQTELSKVPWADIKRMAQEA